MRGQILKVNGAEIQAYEYRSGKTARKEADALNGDGMTVGTSSINWIALYVGDNRRVFEILDVFWGSK